MTSPRTLVMAGAVLIAVALAASGHGYWWLIGLVWALPHVARDGRGGCARRLPRQDPEPVSQPDPTSDRHVAFPQR